MKNSRTAKSLVLLYTITATVSAQTPVITGNPVTIQGRLRIVDAYAHLRFEASPGLSTMNLIGTSVSGRLPRLSLWDGNISISSNMTYIPGQAWVRDNPLTGASRVVVGGDWIEFNIWPTTGPALKRVLVVNDQGNVGIGSTDPAAKLHLSDSNGDYLQAGNVFRIANNGDIYQRGSLFTGGVKGDKGDTGAQGPTGTQGLKGDKGEQGIPGSFSCACTGYCQNGMSQSVGKAISNTDCQSGGAYTFCSTRGGLKYARCN